MMMMMMTNNNYLITVICIIGERAIYKINGLNTVLQKKTYDHLLNDKLNFDDKMNYNCPFTTMF